MKKLMFIPIIIILFGCSGNRDATVSGTLDDIQDGTIILLSRIDEQGRYEVLGSDSVSGNKFAVNLGTLQRPERVILSVAGTTLPGEMTLWVAPGKTVKVTGSGIWAGSWTAEAITPEQEELNRYHLPTVSLLTEKGKLLQQIEDIFADGTPSLEERDRRDEKIVKLYDALDSLNMEISAIELKVQNNPREFSALYVEKLKSSALNSYYGEYSHSALAVKLREMAREQYKQVEDELKELKEYQLITSRLYPKDRIVAGDFFEDTRFYDSEGRADCLANYIGKGKYIMIDCWFTACHPCIDIMPEVNNLKEEFKDDLIVIGLNFYDKKEQWLKGTEKLNVNGVNFWTPKKRQGLVNKYGFMFNPVFALISSEGELIKVFHSTPLSLIQDVGNYLYPERYEPYSGIILGGACRLLDRDEDESQMYDALAAKD